MQRIDIIIRYLNKIVKSNWVVFVNFVVKNFNDFTESKVHIADYLNS